MDETGVNNALREVMDPELGHNIVELGLVYEVTIEAALIHVRMTATSPSCPMTQYLVDAAERAIRNAAPSVRTVHVEMVWDPPWSPKLMHPDLQKQFGW